MITLQITPQQISRAENLYSFDNLRGSITKGNSNLYGALGEIVVMDYFEEKDVLAEATYDYDLIIDGYKVDVKTKKTTVTPKPEYLCSISAFNTKQKCDYYFFIRVDLPRKKAFLLGYIEKEKFFQKAFFKKKGELDVNGFVFKDDCYNLPISALRKFREHGNKQQEV